MQDVDRAVSQAAVRAIARFIVVAVIAFALLGCNSSAKVTTATSQASSAVLRSDQFLAATANDTAWVAVGTNGVIVSGLREAPVRTRHVLPGTVSLLGIAAC